MRIDYTVRGLAVSCLAAFVGACGGGGGGSSAAPGPGTLQFSEPSYQVNEKTGSITIAVTRTGGSAGAVAVNYTTANVTAQAPGDYAAKSGILSWADGDSANKTFTIDVADDASAEGPETVQLSLSNATGGAALGANASATLVIDDTPGTILFTQTTFTVLENAGTARVTVSRQGGSNGSVSVTFKTADTDAIANPTFPGQIASSRTATPGSDYTPPVPGANTLTFNNGETSKDIEIPILYAQNDPVEPDETLEVALCEASGTNVGPEARAVLTIADFQASASPGIVLSPTALNRPGQLPINVHPEITLSTLVDQNSLTPTTARVRCEGFDINNDPDTQEFPSAAAIFDPDEKTVTIVPAISQPATGLPTGYSCVAVLTNGVKDTTGTPITNNSELVSPSFTIGDETDTFPPTVTPFSPIDGTTLVAVNSVVVADVKDYMINSLSLNSKNIQLSFKEDNKDRLVAATVSFPRPDTDAPTTGSETITYRVTLKPACDLRPNTQYTVRFKGEHAGVTKGVRDITGRPLAADVTWSFKTAP